MSEAKMNGNNIKERNGIGVIKARPAMVSRAGARYLREQRRVGLSKRTFELRHGRKIEEISEKMARAERVVLAIHERPDGDAVSSALALRGALREAGKEAMVYSPDPVPGMFGFLRGVNSILGRDEVGSFYDFDLAVMLDAHEAERVGLPKDLPRRVETAAIDHHPKQAEVDFLALIEDGASSTAELVYYFVRKFAGEMKKDAATAILTGLVTDTGRFQYSNTTPASLEIAAEAVRAGAQLNKIVRNTFQNMDVRLLRLWGVALRRLRRSAETGAVVTVLRKEDIEGCGLSVDDDLVLGGLASMMAAAPEAKFAMLLSEMDKETVKGSLRADPSKRVDVSKIAGEFGGGGHKLSSGFQIQGKIERSGDTWRIT